MGRCFSDAEILVLLGTIGPADALEIEFPKLLRDLDTALLEIDGGTEMAGGYSFPPHLEDERAYWIRLVVAYRLRRETEFPKLLQEIAARLAQGGESFLIRMFHNLKNLPDLTALALTQVRDDTRSL